MAKKRTTGGTTSASAAPQPWNDQAESELYGVLFDLHEALSEAYWAAGTMADKDEIRGVSDVVYEVMTTLNQTVIQARSP